MSKTVEEDTLHADEVKRCVGDTGSIVASKTPRVLVVGENAALRMGGEGSFPYLYFKLLRARGVEVWLACHARTRDELRELLGSEAFQRVSFVEEDFIDLPLSRIDQYLPAKLREQTIAVVRHLRIRQLLRPIIRGVIQ